MEVKPKKSMETGIVKLINLDQHMASQKLGKWLAEPWKCLLKKTLSESLTKTNHAKLSGDHFKDEGVTSR